MRKRIIFLKDVDFLDIKAGQIVELKNGENNREYFVQNGNKIHVSSTMRLGKYFENITADYKEPKLYPILAEVKFLYRYQRLAENFEEAKKDVIENFHKIPIQSCNLIKIKILKPTKAKK